MTVGADLGPGQKILTSLHIYIYLLLGITSKTSVLTVAGPITSEATA